MKKHIYIPSHDIAINNNKKIEEKRKKTRTKNSSHFIFQVDTVTFAYTYVYVNLKHATSFYSYFTQSCSLDLTFSLSLLRVCLTYSILPFFFGRSNLSGVLNICKVQYYTSQQLMFTMSGNSIERKKNSEHLVYVCMCVCVCLMDTFISCIHM